MALLITWLQSKPKHYEKYCELYTERGFDVVVVTPKELHVIRPTTGSQVLAGNIIKFLENNDYYDKMLIQGFSMAGYFWSECLVQLHANGQFQSISDRFKCQVWDSITGMKQVAIGFAKSMFPQNKTLQNLTTNFLNFYLKVNYKTATQYYARGTIKEEFFLSQTHHIISTTTRLGEDYFHNKSLKAPVLVFASKIDPVATEEKAKEAVATFEKQNIDVTFKLFDKSSHVQHYQKYEKEYLSYLDSHLKTCKFT
jgi:Eukaryotic protein of unknown function (DUF829)